MARTALPHGSRTRTSRQYPFAVRGPPGRAKTRTATAARPCAWTQNWPTPRPARDRLRGKACSSGQPVAGATGQGLRRCWWAGRGESRPGSVRDNGFRPCFGCATSAWRRKRCDGRARAGASGRNQHSAARARGLAGAGRGADGQRGAVGRLSSATGISTPRRPTATRRASGRGCASPGCRATRGVSPRSSSRAARIRSASSRDRSSGSGSTRSTCIWCTGPRAGRCGVAGHRRARERGLTRSVGVSNYSARSSTR